MHAPRFAPAALVMAGYGRRHGEQIAGLSAATKLPGKINHGQGASRPIVPHTRGFCRLFFLIVGCLGGIQTAGWKLHARRRHMAPSDQVYKALDIMARAPRKIHMGHLDALSASSPDVW